MVEKKRIELTSGMVENIFFVIFHLSAVLNLICIFFFQAEDGIRDYKVTGVQTCALPIWRLPQHSLRWLPRQSRGRTRQTQRRCCRPDSEERRVGKECRSRWSPYH